MAFPFLNLLLVAMLKIVASTTPAKCGTHADGQKVASAKTSDGERLIFFTSGQYLYQMKVCGLNDYMN